MSNNASGEQPFTKDEFVNGVVWWLATGWPTDFHNNDYKQMESRSHPKNVEISDDNIFSEMFSEQWWDYILDTLWKWQAFRGVKGLTKHVVQSRARSITDSLKQEFETNIKPLLISMQNVSTTEYKLIESFIQKVCFLKLETESPVMASKFGHFCAPNLIPVTDEAALGNPGGRSLQSYFELIKGCWNKTPDEIKWWQQQLLHWCILDTVKDATLVWNQFPYITKCAELSLIGRNHGDITLDVNHKFWDDRDISGFVKIRHILANYIAPACYQQNPDDPTTGDQQSRVLANQRRTFKDGMFKVGEEIAAGRYLGTPTTPSGNIYFERLEYLGQQSGRPQNYFGKGQVWVEIKEGEYFRSEGAEWHFSE